MGAVCEQELVFWIERGWFEYERQVHLCIRAPESLNGKRRASPCELTSHLTTCLVLRAILGNMFVHFPCEVENRV